MTRRSHFTPRSATLAMLVALLFATACTSSQPIENADSVGADAPEVDQPASTDPGPIRASTTVLSLGDSIFDWLHEDGQEVPQVAAAFVGLTVVNEAQQGAHLVLPAGSDREPSFDIREQWNGRSVERPDWVILNGGLNDLDQECGCNECIDVLDRLISVEGVNGELVELVGRITNGGSKLLIVGYAEFPDEPIGFCNDILADYAERIARLAEQNQSVWFADSREVVTADMDAAFDGDGVHPTVLGAALMGNHAGAILAAADPTVTAVSPSTAGDAESTAGETAMVSEIDEE